MAAARGARRARTGVRRGLPARESGEEIGAALATAVGLLSADSLGLVCLTTHHQDEGYWGRNLEDRGITRWLPLQDVDERNGCMHFIERGHQGGVLPHRQPEHVQSDLLFCEPDLSRAVACPIRAGSVTFHHGKTLHMTPANRSDAWRRAVTTHIRLVGSLGEGDHYPWKVYVNQVTGERGVPPTR
jgi:hypothetical protein